MMPFVYINLYIITMNFYGKDLLQNAWAQSLVSIMLPEGSSISEGSALVGTLNQWNYMSGMFAMMTVMYLAWAVTSQKWVDNIVGAVTASAAIIVMFMSVSTSGFLTVLVVGAVILVAALLTKKKGQAVVSLAIFFLIAAPVFHVLAEKDYRVWTESFGFFTEKNPYMEEVTALLNTTNVAHASKEVLELPVLPERATAAGSGRTYIWDKTLDLVGNRAILGYGNDTLIYNFPHYSLDARSGMKDENTITDKPHNQFVGVLYGFGIFGLVALVMLVVATGIAAFRAIIKKAWAELVLALTIFTYFSQSMFNDSLPASSGFTFVLIGILFAQQVIKSQENAVNGRNN